MLSTKELRIGNLVNAISSEPNASYPTGVVQVVDILDGDGINLSQIECAAYREQDIEGIPLTEQWLKTLGWRWNNGYENDKFPHIAIDGGMATVVSGNPWSFWVMINNTQVRLRHVHQLQNLAFALTRKDIDVKIAP